VVDEPEGQNDQPEGFELVIEPSQMAGVWANFAQVSHTEHEFTLDFVRRDSINPSRGIVVARVAVSPLFVTQLIEALNANWKQYAEKAMPKEVQDAEERPDDDTEGQGA
jgi:Protein of unknown function (DUF3467)